MLRAAHERTLSDVKTGCFTRLSALFHMSVRGTGNREQERDNPFKKKKRVTLDLLSHSKQANHISSFPEEPLGNNAGFLTLYMCHHHVALR